MRRLAAVLLVVLTLAGCAADPAPPPPAFNSTDVMFLQMSLDHIRQGEQVVGLAERAVNPQVRAQLTGLGDEWRDEAGTMQRWLTGWQQPPSADPAAGAHAGHGDLHSLRPADIAELTAARGADFDRTAVSLLLGHLHNCVEVTRMEAAGGRYPPAKALADTMTTRRQSRIQVLLTLIAAG